MRWPWQKKQPLPLGGEQARRDAEEHLAEARSRRDEFDAQTQMLRAMRARNNFAAGIEASMRRRR